MSYLTYITTYSLDCCRTNSYCIKYILIYIMANNVYLSKRWKSNTPK